MRKTKYGNIEAERVRLGLSKDDFAKSSGIATKTYYNWLNGTPPTKWNGDIVLYTAGDVECATLSGWTTVYRDEGQTVYLSDDGSMYQTPDPDTGGEILPPEPYEPTLEELQAAKKREISQACETAIYSGVDVNLSDESTQHFSLTEHD